MHFCWSCGIRLPEKVRFCTACGAAVHAESTSATTATSVGSPAAVRPVPPVAEKVVSRRRPRWLMVVALMVVAGLGFGAYRVIRGPNVTGFIVGSSEVTAFPESMTSEPERQWTWQASADSVNIGALADSEQTYIADTDGSPQTQLVALDSDGAQAWVTQLDGGFYLAREAPDGEMLLLSNDEGGLVGVSTRDGSRQWKIAHGVPGITVENGFFDPDDDGLALRDFSTGEVLWQQPAVDRYSISGDTCYVVRGAQVSALDVSSGDLEWSAEAPMTIADDADVEVAATNELVLVGSGSEVAALDPEKGKQLWSREFATTSVSVGVAARDLAYVETSADEDAGTDGLIEFFDESGKRGEIAESVDDAWFLPVGMTVGDQPYFVDWATGNGYEGDELQRIGSYPGSLEPVLGGVYSLDGSMLAFYEFGETGPTWQITVDEADTEDGASMIVGDRAVLIQSANGFARYG